jgi:hypothetical protein
MKCTGWCDNDFDVCGYLRDAVRDRRRAVAWATEGGGGVIISNVVDHLPRIPYIFISIRPWGEGMVINRRTRNIPKHPETTTNAIWTGLKPTPKPETKTERRLITMVIIDRRRPSSTDSIHLYFNQTGVRHNDSTVTRLRLPIPLCEPRLTITPPPAA